MKSLILIKRFNVSALISLLAYSSSCLFGSSFTALESDFTSQTDDWGAGADYFRSTQDAIDPGNWYLRSEINLLGGETNKNKMVIRRPVASTVIGSDPWLGNFNAKGIQSVELDFNNWSADEPVYLRLALSNVAKPMISTGTWWVSTSYATFFPGSGWRSASFNILEAEMQRVGSFSGVVGQDTFEETLSDIQGFRFIASATGDSALGDEFSGAIGMDNIRLISAIPEPSRFAFAMGLLATISLLRRRPR